VPNRNLSKREERAYVMPKGIKATPAPVTRTAEREVECSIADDSLVITIPIKQQLSVSRGGKHIMVASTHGNLNTGLVINDKEVYLQVNAWTEL